MSFHRIEHFQRYCKICGKDTLHIRSSGDEWLGIGIAIGMTLVSCGCLLPVAFVVWGLLIPKPRCNVCGAQN